MFGQVPAGRPGDWMCPGCRDLQFAKNTQCRRCKTMRPGQPGMMAVHPGGGGGLVTGGYGGSNQVMLAGDWICTRCRDHQFARNTSCRRCGAPRAGMENPTTASLYGGEGGLHVTMASSKGAGLGFKDSAEAPKRGFSDAPKRGFSDAPPSGFHAAISKPPSLKPGDQPYDPLQPPSGDGGVVEAMLQEKIALHGVPAPPEGPPPEENNSGGKTIFIWGPGASVDTNIDAAVRSLLAGAADRSRSRSDDRKRGRKESRSSSRSQARRKKKTRKDKKNSKEAESRSSSGSSDGSSSEEDADQEDAPRTASKEVGDGEQKKMSSKKQESRESPSRKKKKRQRDASESSRAKKKKKSKKAKADSSSESTAKSSSSSSRKKKKKKKS